MLCTLLCDLRECLRSRRCAQSLRAPKQTQRQRRSAKTSAAPSSLFLSFKSTVFYSFVSIHLPTLSKHRSVPSLACLSALFSGNNALADSPRLLGDTVDLQSALRARTLAVDEMKLELKRADARVVELEVWFFMFVFGFRVPDGPIVCLVLPFPSDGKPLRNVVICVSVSFGARYTTFRLNCTAHRSNPLSSVRCPLFITLSSIRPPPSVTRPRSPPNAPPPPRFAPKLRRHAGRSDAEGDNNYIATINRKYLNNRHASSSHTRAVLH
jgi:hypothetical protein